MTYYGRWTYKYEMAQKIGAAAMFIVHETGPAGYALLGGPGEDSRAVRASRGRTGNMTRAAVEGWIPLEQAKALFALAGQDFDAMKKARASRASSAPVPLGVTASITLQQHDAHRRLAQRRRAASRAAIRS